MKILVLAFIFTILSFGIAEAGVRHDGEVTLKIGQARSVHGTPLRIRFAAVVEDSRCPEGAECVWAGNAKIRIQVSTRGGSPKMLELNSNLAPTTAVYNGYEIKIVSLTPKPGEMRKTSGVTAVLSVRKA